MVKNVEYSVGSTSDEGTIKTRDYDLWFPGLRLLIYYIHISLQLHNIYT